MQMKTKKIIFNNTLFAFFICTILVISGYRSVIAQTGKQIKWLRVGSLHSWYLNWGSEIELGRTGQAREQQDGLRWPAQFRNQDTEVAKAIWIGTKDYEDRNGKTYPHKVIAAGPRECDEKYQLIPVEFKMLGRFYSPKVYVDGLPATDNELNDVVDAIDPNLKPDRMIVNKLNSYIGITVTRKIMAFAQQNHDNYFIYEYVFKNTGVVDINGNTDPKTLNDVIFYFQYRYGFGLDAFRKNWAPSNNINWGRNCVNQVVGIGPNKGDFDFRAQYSWYGIHSKSPVDDWGCPNPKDGSLAAVQYTGNVILHADTSPHDPTDDVKQPSTTMYIGSDCPATKGSDQFNSTLMDARYALMAAGHPGKTHADEVGDGFADQWGTDPGGYTHGQGFGPYTLEPGDSIRIVIAEGVSGISRQKSVEVGNNWYQHHANIGEPVLILPDGQTTTDEDEYKRLWVQTGEDSLFQTFRRAITNFKNDYKIPQPPPPPNTFEVNSGGDRITLSWSNNAETWEYFDGYDIYRAVGKPDTLYEKIFSCNKSDVVNVYEDKTARRGFDYYYYIQSKDDGSQNDINPGIPLVSSKFYTMTNQPAYLRRPGGKSLSEIRVVPNPYNIRASSLQFGVDAPDRLAFFGLPPECTIKIFTERGDLVDTIEHTDGTGDELWHSMTSSGQIIVSGVYIAYFEVPRDYRDSNGNLLFRKGDNITRKFVIIR